MLSPVLLTDQLQIGGSHDPILRLGHLLEWLLELRGEAYLHRAVIVKATTQEQTEGRDVQGKAWGGGWSFLPGPLCSAAGECSDPTFCGGSSLGLADYISGGCIQSPANLRPPHQRGWG